MKHVYMVVFVMCWRVYLTKKALILFCANRRRKQGITGPLNTDPPSAVEIDLTTQLEATLKEHNVFDTDEGIEHR